MDQALPHRRDELLVHTEDLALPADVKWLFHIVPEVPGSRWHIPMTTLTFEARAAWQSASVASLGNSTAFRNSRSANPKLSSLVAGKC